MKTNGGQKSVCSSYGDETSTVKEDRETGHKKALRLYIFFGRRPEMVGLGMICVQIEDRCRLMLKLCS